METWRIISDTLFISLFSTGQIIDDFLQIPLLKNELESQLKKKRGIIWFVPWWFFAPSGRNIWAHLNPPKRDRTFPSIPILDRFLRRKLSENRLQAKRDLKQKKWSVGFCAIVVACIVDAVDRVGGRGDEEIRPFFSFKNNSSFNSKNWSN